MLQDLENVLTEISIRLSIEPSGEIIDELANILSRAHDYSNSNVFIEEFKSLFQSHLLHGMILGDPNSRRAFEKRRGYAGDAVMLDYIYKPRNLSLSRVGEIVHKATVGLPNARSIIWRRKYLADQICRSLERNPNARIFSVASGHMRELDIVGERIGHRNFQIFALDQDPASIQEAVHSYPNVRIRPINKSISHILRGRLSNETFDLIYSAGLFNYLVDKTAEALIRKLYDLLEPEAVLAIGNFAPDSHGRSIMGAFMDWTLIYRDEKDMIRLVEESAPLAVFNVFRDDPGNVVYIEIRKAR